MFWSEFKRDERGMSAAVQMSAWLSEGRALSQRGVPASCLRQVKEALELDRGMRVSGAFCSGSIIRDATR